MLRLRVCGVGFIAAIVPAICVSQQTNGAANAFREHTRGIHEKLILVVGSMPADKYSFRATEGQLSFADIIVKLGANNDYLCSRIAGVDRPPRSAATSRMAKDTLISWLRETTDFCARTLMALHDSTLSDSIAVDMRNLRIGPVGRKTRASIMTLTTAFWSDAYAHFSGYLRLNGRIPPKPCGSGEPEALDCGSGPNVCVDVRGGEAGRMLTLSDSPYSVTSDGKGPYVLGKGNVLPTGISGAIVLLLRSPRAGDSEVRGIKVDLSQPVSGDIGVPLGIITANQHLEVAAQWYSGSDHRPQSIRDIPIGTTVFAAQTDVEFAINGVQHSLQMGPQPEGHCYADQTAIHGTGTTRSTIMRSDSTTWIIDLPPGSVGRLFDVHLSYPNAINKGLYYVSLRFVMQK